MLESSTAFFEVGNNRERFEMLTQKRLKEILNYDPETGIFIWRERLARDGRRLGCAGKEAGTVKKDGYIIIKYDEVCYPAHRLVWLYLFGYIPEYEVDHLDRVRHNNRAENLREVSPSCNCQNQKVKECNKSGITGVCWHKSSNKWRSYLSLNNKKISLGYSTSLLDAAKARYAGEKEYFTCVVDSSAEKYIQDHS